MNPEAELFYQRDMMRQLKAGGISPQTDDERYKLMADGFEYAVENAIQEWQDEGRTSFEQLLVKAKEPWYADNRRVIYAQKSGHDADWASIGYLLGLRRMMVYDKYEHESKTFGP